MTGAQTYGGSATLNVSPTSGPTQPYTGSVSCTTVNGGTSITPTLAAGGTYTLDGDNCSGLSLTGNDATDYTLVYSGGAFNVSEAGTSTTVTSSTSSPVVGQSVTYTATVAASSGRGRRRGP